MRCPFIGFLLAVVTTAVGGCGGEEGPRRAPAMVFAATTYDFGRVSAGSAVRHDFTFTNEGDLDLTIDTIKTG